MLAHAWDVAKATGQDTDLDPELAEQILGATRPFLAPSLRGEGRPFGPEQPCPDGASPADAAGRLPRPRRLSAADRPLGAPFPCLSAQTREVTQRSGEARSPQANAVR